MRIEDEGTKLIIGKFCSIASNVTIMLGGEHRVDWFRFKNHVRRNNSRRLHYRRKFSGNEECVRTLYYCCSNSAITE